MKLYDLVRKEDLDRGIAEKLINVRSSGDGQSIYNYSDAAMYTPGSWDNPAVRICRGLIVDDATLDIVARPWEKFFNYGQAEAGDFDLDATVEVTDKRDGSLGIIHLDSSGNVRVATRGSFESDQAIWATKWINEHWPFKESIDHSLFRQTLGAFTHLVEIVYPENRIVCNYGDYEGLVLLGVVSVERGYYFSPTISEGFWTGDVTDVFPYRTLREALEAPPRPGAEGFCVRFSEADGDRIVKIKQEDYIRLHKIVTGLSEKSVWEHLASGASFNELIAPLPDELHEWTGQVWDGLVKQLDNIHYEVNEIFNEVLAKLPKDAHRSAWAEEFKKYPEYRALLFLRLDKRDLTPAILKTLKPRGDSRAKTFSEETA